MLADDAVRHKQAHAGAVFLGCEVRLEEPLTVLEPHAWAVVRDPDEVALGA